MIQTHKKKGEKKDEGNVKKMVMKISYCFLNLLKKFLLALLPVIFHLFATDFCTSCRTPDFKIFPVHPLIKKIWKGSMIAWLVGRLSFVWDTEVLNAPPDLPGHTSPVRTFLTPW